MLICYSHSVEVDELLEAARLAEIPVSVEVIPELSLWGVWLSTRADLALLLDVSATEVRYICSLAGKPNHELVELKRKRDSSASKNEGVTGSHRVAYGTEEAKSLMSLEPLVVELVGGFEQLSGLQIVIHVGDGTRTRFDHDASLHIHFWGGPEGAAGHPRPEEIFGYRIDPKGRLAYPPAFSKALTVHDAKYVPVAQVLLRNVFLLLPIHDEPRLEDVIKVVLAEALQLVASGGDPDSISGILAMKNAYLSSLRYATLSSKRRIQVKVGQAEHELNRLRDMLDQASGDSSAALKNFHGTASELRHLEERLQRDLECFARENDVEAITIVDGSCSIVARKVVAVSPKGRHLIGDLEITLKLAQSDSLTAQQRISVINLGGTREYDENAYEAPHVVEGGLICVGNAETQLSMLFGIWAIPEIVVTILKLICTPLIGDPWGDAVAAFPLIQE